MTDPAPIMVWRPSLRVFLGRTAFVAGLTTLVFSPGVLFTPLESWVYLLVILAGFAFWTLFYAFIFDEHMAWLRSRDDRWELHHDTLAYRSAFDDNERGEIAILQIRKIKRWFWWGLRIKMDRGPSIAMNYLRDTKAIRDAIWAQHAVRLAEQDDVV